MRGCCFRLGWLLWYALFLAACGASPQAMATAKSSDKRAEPLLSEMRQLTFAGRRASTSAFRGDGSQLLFQSEREPNAPTLSLYWMDLKSGETRRLPAEVGRLHPSKKHVLFSSTEPGTPKTLHADADLKMLDLTSKTLSSLGAARGYDSEGAWSPDGKTIVFTSNRHAYTDRLKASERKRLAADPAFFLDLYLMGADGGDVRRLTDSEGYDGEPAFSRDGKYIVWRRFLPKQNCAEIFSMQRDGSERRQLTQLHADAANPSFHPSGDYVIFAARSGDTADSELFLIDARGRRDAVRVTQHPAFDSEPVFSPDGGTLAWSRAPDSDAPPQIFLATWNDAVARRLLELPTKDPLDTSDTRSAANTPSSPRSAIRNGDLLDHITALTSERMDGRLTASDGEERAADYVASVFRNLGLEPAGDGGGFLQSFAFEAGIALGLQNRLRLRAAGAAQTPGATQSTQEWELGRDWRPLSFSRRGHVPESPVAFAGYGIVTPGDGQEPAYDAYAELDVRNKWVVVLRYTPERAPKALQQRLHPYSSLRHKSLLALERGALGLIVISGPNTKVREELVPLRSDALMEQAGLAVVSLSDAAGEKLLQSAGRSLRMLQDSLDGGEVVPGFELSGVRLEAEIDLISERRRGHNVLARLPAQSEQHAASAILLGAHLDHLGRGFVSNAPAREAEQGQIHCGADDNASGVAALLEIAEFLSTEQQAGRLTLEKDILFAAWSGNELGLLGSSDFVRTRIVQAAPAPLFAAYLNLDGVGRLAEHLLLDGVRSSPHWPRVIERGNAPVGLNLTWQELPALPTDALYFDIAGIPTLSASTGIHADYHTPYDTAERLNYDGIQRVATFIARIVSTLAATESAPTYARARAAASTTPEQTQLPQQDLLRPHSILEQTPSEKDALETQP